MKKNLVKKTLASWKIPKLVGINFARVLSWVQVGYWFVMYPIGYFVGYFWAQLNEQVFEFVNNTIYSIWAMEV